MLDLYRDEKLFERAEALEPDFADAAMVRVKSVPGRCSTSCAPWVDRRHRLRPRARRLPGKRAYEAMERGFNDEVS